MSGEATVTVWAVKQGSDQMYYNGITVSPDEEFMLTVMVCAHKSGFWDVVLNLLDENGNPVCNDWLLAKGHGLQAGGCMRPAFTLKYPKSGYVKINVYYSPPDSSESILVWSGRFSVRVEKLPSVKFYNSKLVYKGKTYHPNSTVKVDAGDTVEVTSTAVSSVPANITFELYDEYNDKVLSEKTVHVTEGSNIHLSFTAEEYCHPVLRALYKSEIVGTDGGWVVSVEGTSPKPKPSQPSKKKEEFISITPVEAAAIGLLVGSVIVLFVGGRNG